MSSYLSSVSRVSYHKLALNDSGKQLLPFILSWWDCFLIVNNESNQLLEWGREREVSSDLHTLVHTSWKIVWRHHFFGIFFTFPLPLSSSIRLYSSIYPPYHPCLVFLVQVPIHPGRSRMNQSFLDTSCWYYGWIVFFLNPFLSFDICLSFNCCIDFLLSASRKRMFWCRISLARCVWWSSPGEVYTNSWWLKGMINKGIRVENKRDRETIESEVL